MRRLFAVILTMLIVMASLPLQSVFADSTGSSSMDMSVEMVDSAEAIDDCCDRPMGSSHHNNLQCSMECPALTTWSSTDLVQLADLVLNATNDDFIGQTFLTHFRPPIFS